MKKVAAILLATALTNAAVAQGLVTFANDPTTLIGTMATGGTPTAYAVNPVGSYYFGLLISTTAVGPFSFTGVYATNTTDAGRFGSASYTPAVPGWTSGATMFYEVAGWSASLGMTFNTNWLTWLSVYFQAPGYFGVSQIASGVAGASAPQAKLSVSIAGDTIVISWMPIGGSLQTSPSLGPGETWSTVGTANPATVPKSGNAKFFRVVPLDIFGPSSLQGFSLEPTPLL